MTPLIPITAGLRIAARLGNSDLVLPVTQHAAALANTPRSMTPGGYPCVEMLAVEGVEWTDQGAEYRGHVVWVRWNPREGKES